MNEFGEPESNFYAKAGTWLDDARVLSDTTDVGITPHSIDGVFGQAHDHRTLEKILLEARVDEEAIPTLVVLQERREAYREQHDIDILPEQLAVLGLVARWKLGF